MWKYHSPSIRMRSLNVLRSSSSSAMPTRVKQRAMIELSTVEKVTPTEIHRRLKAAYGDDAVDRST